MKTSKPLLNKELSYCGAMVLIAIEAIGIG